MRTLEPDRLAEGPLKLPGGDHCIVEPEAIFVAFKTPVARARHVNQIGKGLLTEPQLKAFPFELLGQALFVVEVHATSMPERVVQLRTKLPAPRGGSANAKSQVPPLGPQVGALLRRTASHRIRLRARPARMSRTIAPGMALRQWLPS